MAYNKIVSLVYFWLKENKLLKTCKSLEEEYGKVIKEPDGTSCSLENIIQTNKAMLVLFSVLVDVNKKPTRNRTRKNSTSVVDNSTGKGKTASSSTDTNEIAVPVLKKKKYTCIAERKHDEHTKEKQSINTHKKLTADNCMNEKPADEQGGEIKGKKKESKISLSDKKKKRKLHDLEDTYNGVGECPEVVSGHKKKKKKHKSSIEHKNPESSLIQKKKRKSPDVQDTHNTVGNGIEEIPEVEPKKKKKKKHKSNIDGSHQISEIPESTLISKKKKKKAKLEAEVTENITDIDTTEGNKQNINSKEVGNEIILNNLGDMLKKKKKKKKKKSISST